MRKLSRPAIMITLGVVVLALRLFVALCPAALVAQHRQRLDGAAMATETEQSDVVDATYRVLDERS